MPLETVFSGTAWRSVDEDGAIVLPDFILRTLERRSDARRILFSPHETDPCMSAYDIGHEAWLFAETERRRLREESLGVDAAQHHRRARRTFGATEAADYDADGRVVLPPSVRARGRIDEAVLVIGTGGSFEIWNPDVARDSGDEEVRVLAAFALAARAAEQKEVGA